MSMFEDTNPRELKELLRQVHDGESVPRKFQQDPTHSSGRRSGT